jgi:hypothetical protein
MHGYKEMTQLHPGFTASCGLNQSAFLICGIIKHPGSFTAQTTTATLTHEVAYAQVGQIISGCGCSLRVGRVRGAVGGAPTRRVIRFLPTRLFSERRIASGGAGAPRIGCRGSNRHTYGSDTMQVSKIMRQHGRTSTNVATPCGRN